MRVVTVVFTPSKNREYTYFVPEGDEPKVGDIVITSIQSEVFPDNKTVSPDLNPLEVKPAVILYGGGATGTIIKLNGISDAATRQYLARVPASVIAERIEGNIALRDAAARRREALAELEHEFEKASKVELYRQLASTNPRIAELMKLADLE